MVQHGPGGVAERDDGGLLVAAEEVGGEVGWAQVYGVVNELGY